MRAFVGVLGLTWASLALAEGTAPPQDPAGVHRHVGLSVHAALGAGYLQSTPGGPGAVSGASVTLGLTVGAAFTENWILAADLWGTFAPAAGFSGASGIGARLELGFLGAELRHYFMPINIFVALAPGATLLSRSDDASGGQTRLGWGVKLSAGKEWWVSDAWAVGLAAYGLVSFSKDPPQQNTPDSGNGFGPAVTWTTFGAGLVVTLSNH